MLQVHRLSRSIGAIAVCAGLLTGSALVAAPAQADPSSDAFLDAVTSAGLGGTTDPADVVALGKSVCPMLSDPGQKAGDVAAKVADTTGMSLGGANLFTGLAISFLCPRVVDSIGAGQSPIPTGLLGF
jgi:hypothetical protein